MTTNEARAARAGRLGWQTYIREAQTDPTVPAADRQRIARAMGSAEAADALRQRIEDLTVERAQATPAAATAANVTDTIGAEMNAFAQRVEVYRPPFVAFICTLVGVFGAWWVVALLEHLNPKDVLRSGWADAEHRIEDLRGAEVVDSEGRPKTVEPMDPPRTVVTDAETGEELVRVKGSDPHWRRKVQKGKKTKVEVQVEQRGPASDETGVAQDGGGRIALTPAGPMDMSAFGAVTSNAETNQENHAEQEQPSDGVADLGPSDALIQDEPPIPDDAEAIELAAVLPDESASEAVLDELEENANPAPKIENGEKVVNAEQASNESQPESEHTHPTPPSEDREPQTDPSRLIAAE